MRVINSAANTATAAAARSSWGSVSVTASSVIALVIFKIKDMPGDFRRLSFGNDNTPGTVNVLHDE